MSNKPKRRKVIEEIWRSVDCLIDFVKFRQIINNIPDNIAETVEIEIDADDYNSPELCIYYDRLQTDEEYEETLKQWREQEERIRKNKEKNKEKEYKTYLRLKKKYEK